MSRVASHLRELLKPQEDYELLREDTLKRFHQVGCKTAHARRGPATFGCIGDPREYLDRDEV